jgi:hypothetical protein
MERSMGRRAEEGAVRHWRLKTWRERKAADPPIGEQQLSISVDYWKPGFHKDVNALFGLAMV